VSKSVRIAVLAIACVAGTGMAQAEAGEAAVSAPSFEAYGNQGGYANVVDVVQDPLAPNWRIEQATRPDSTFELALRMKRFRAGGDGEGRQVFHRHAADLARDHGYSGYEVLRYEESLESAMLGSQRTIRGAIRLTGKTPG